MLDHEVLIFSLLGGIIPAYLWLRFWLREDNHQEPRHLILKSFLMGGFVILFALPVERFFYNLVPNFDILAITLFALTEELFKFIGAYFIAIRTRFNNEPIDATIYLITVALGFAAFENTLFVLNPFSQGDVVAGISLLNLRFMGATLLHVVCSGFIGIALGYVFYKDKFTKIITAIFAVIGATVLHTLFNNFIITSEQKIFFIFSGVWVAVALIIIILEKIKKIKKTKIMSSFFKKFTRALTPEEHIEIEEVQDENQTKHLLQHTDSDGELTVDVFNTPSAIVIKTLVAGVKKENLNIELSRDMITVRGKREQDETIHEENYFHRELYWGSFSRTIILPEEVDINLAEATESQGLLTIRLPKVDKGRQTKLKVRSI